MNTPTTKQNAAAHPAAGRRPLAWLTVFAGLPVLIVLSILWCRFMSWLLSLIQPHLSGFFSDLLDDFLGDTIIPIASGVIFYLAGTWFAERAERLCPTRKGWRYYAAAACSLALAALCSVWAIRGRLPFRLPYQPRADVLVNVIVALAGYAAALVKAVWELRKERKKLAQPPEHICVFCFTEKPKKQEIDYLPKPKDRGLVPFCYITGGSALVSNKGSLEVPGRNGQRLDLELFQTYKNYVFREELVPEQEDWLTVNAFDGYIIDGKAICPDLIQCYPDHDKWNYADLLHSPLLDKKAAAFDLGSEETGSRGELRSCRHYRVDEHGALVHAFRGRSPREEQELLKRRTGFPVDDGKKPAAPPAKPKEAPAPQPATKTVPKAPTQSARAAAPKTQTPAAGPAAPVKQPLPPQNHKKPAAAIVFDTSVTEAWRKLVGQAVRDTQTVFPMLSLENAELCAPSPESVRHSMDSYFEGAKQASGKYDATVILRNLKGLAERKKDFLVIVLFTGKDLCLSSQKADWVFGAANYGSHTVVASVCRYRELTDAEKLRCLRRTLRHELGHALGMAADPKRGHTEQHYGTHCTAAGCSMRQASTLKALLLLSKDEEAHPTPFCPDCLADLRKALPSAGAASKFHNREEAVSTIYRHKYSEIRAACDRLQIKLENLMDIRESFSDEAVFALAEEIDRGTGS